MNIKIYEDRNGYSLLNRIKIDRCERTILVSRLLLKMDVLMELKIINRW